MTRVTTDLNFRRDRQYGFRDSKDGKPYYCETCGMGWGEMMACEESNCKVESEEAAMQRYEPA